MVTSVSYDRAEENHQQPLPRPSRVFLLFSSLGSGVLGQRGSLVVLSLVHSLSLSLSPSLKLWLLGGFLLELFANCDAWRIPCEKETWRRKDETRQMMKVQLWNILVICSIRYFRCILVKFILYIKKKWTTTTLFSSFSTATWYIRLSLLRYISAYPLVCTNPAYCASGLAITVWNAGADSVNRSVLEFHLYSLPFLTRPTERWKDHCCVDLLVHFRALCWRSAACCTWQVPLPVLQPWPDDGLIELRDLPLQHGPQALSKAVVILLQLLLVLLLVRRDQVLVLLHCLSTPKVQTAENYPVSKPRGARWKGKNWFCFLTLFMYINLKPKSSSEIIACKPILP